MKSDHDEIVLTKQILKQLRTRRGGFTRATCEALGVRWPPTRGWLRGLVGLRMRRSTFERIRAKAQAYQAPADGFGLFAGLGATDAAADARGSDDY